MKDTVHIPNAENCSRPELEVAIKAAPTKRSHVRLTAIKALIMGVEANTIAELFSVSSRTLSRWILRFNSRGADGLIERARSGRPRKITVCQSATYKELIEEPQRAGHHHWTGRKFHGYLRDELEHEVGYRTVIRWLHDNDYRLKVAQPWPDRQDEKQRSKWLEELQVLLDVELWYADECGVEGDPRPRRRWAKVGAHNQER